LYTLVVCEKPDAARRIAQALGRATESKIAGGVSIFDVFGDKEHYKVCSASGHLYGVADLTKNRSVYPVLDLEWAPIDEKGGGGCRAARAGRRISAIATLSKDAGRFIHACDYDQEGEVIGHSILQYACGGKYRQALRAKFSTLTDEEIRESFGNLQRPSAGLAEAGRSRHLLDFLYGVNLSRALAQSFLKAGDGSGSGGKGYYYRNLSIGRVQGPTLAFAADRELEIGLHVPDPYWTVTADFVKDGSGGNAVVHATYEKPRVDTAAEAQAIVAACSGKEGTVASVEAKKVMLRPPTPFNIGDLQREAYRLFRASPGYTLAIAEKMYLRALISYPRTSSQKLPRSIDYRKILSGLASSLYSKEAGMLLEKGRLVPHEGAMVDPAHPAVYPTGLVPRGLAGLEFKIYDLVARRFLATFGDPAVTERTQVAIDVGDKKYRFLAEGRATLYEGWMALYRPYVNFEQQQPIPALAQGEALACRQVAAEEKFTQPPWRYSQASLLAKMEQEQIGTKATRADIIATLFKREYLSIEKEGGGGGGIRVTDLGLAVVESMRARVPAIVSTELTRSMEEELEMVERGEQAPAQVISHAVDRLVESLAAFRKNQAEIGRQIRSEGSNNGSNSTGAQQRQNSSRVVIIGQCPLCKTGQLRVITSKATKKRFAGCSNYSSGCRATAPLPQRGGIRGAGKACQCGWPIISVAFGRRAKRWNVCVSMQCPYKEKKKAG
jgi:DNA topoisomerase-1